MSQLDLFPEDFKRVYVDGDCFDLSKPFMQIEDREHVFVKYLKKRIEDLRKLDSDRYYIFRNEPDMPYVYDRDKQKRVNVTDTRRVYSTVVLGGQMFYLHNLVAMFFLENDMPHIKTNVDHLDGNKFNYHPSNLEWVSCGENMRRVLNDKT